MNNGIYHGHHIMDDDRTSAIFNSLQDPGVSPMNRPTQESDVIIFLRMHARANIHRHILPLAKWFPIYCLQTTILTGTLFFPKMKYIHAYPCNSP